ncbi:MAG: hypothetical protein E6J01_18020 [Chloroflexi bacterium]|nr:MAG: hypothetical protein E6J01_18020 [Chloroflexota bacterium]
MCAGCSQHAPIREHLSARAGGENTNGITLPTSGVHEGAEYTRQDLERLANEVSFPPEFLDEWEQTEQRNVNGNKGEVVSDRYGFDRTIAEVRQRMALLGYSA